MVLSEGHRILIMIAARRLRLKIEVFLYRSCRLYVSLLAALGLHLLVIATAGRQLLVSTLGCLLVRLADILWQRMPNDRLSFNVQHWLGEVKLGWWLRLLVIEIGGLGSVLID